MKLTKAQIYALGLFWESPRSFATLSYGVTMNTVNSLIKKGLVARNSRYEWECTIDGSNWLIDNGYVAEDKDGDWELA